MTLNVYNWNANIMNTYQIDGFCPVDDVNVPEAADAFVLIKAAIVESLNDDVAMFTQQGSDENVRLLQIANEILVAINAATTLDELKTQFDIFIV